MDDSLSLTPDKHPNLKENLLEHEKWWRDHQIFLESRGYMLRPRLRPGWKPSWHITGQDPTWAEDAVYSNVRLKLMDATRISDGKMVYIKQMDTGDQESTIARHFNSEELRQFPDNHSVPILDYFPDVNDPNISFMVMPSFREVNEPPFEYVGEVLDFVDQILKVTFAITRTHAMTVVTASQGLAFMHRQGVAHRDCAQFNIMMDAPDMYPRGYHPVRKRRLPDMSDISPFKPRLSVDVKYYFVDYGLSTQFPPGTTSGLVLGAWAQDLDVPELSESVPYDAFKVDIFTIGNIFRRIFCDKFVNVGFLRPIATRMMDLDPSSRPTAEQALSEWLAVSASFTRLGRYRPLRTRHDAAMSYVGQIISGVYSTLRVGSNLALSDTISEGLFAYHRYFSRT